MVTGSSSQGVSEIVPGFWSGILAPFQGLGILLRRPRLFLWTFVPLAIAFALDSTALGFLVPRIRAMVETRIPDEGWYWVAAQWLADFMLGIGFFVAAILMFLVVYLAISGPFNEMLSERIEQLRGHPAHGEGGLSITRAIIDGIRQAAILAIAGLPALLLSLIPLAGPFLFALWSALLLGFSFFEIPLSRRAIPFSRKRTLARRQIASILGLGTAVLLVSLIPFGQLVMMPAFVAGGTILCRAALRGLA